MLVIGSALTLIHRRRSWEVKSINSSVPARVCDRHAHGFSLLECLAGVVLFACMVVLVARWSAELHRERMVFESLLAMPDGERRALN